MKGILGVGFISLSLVLFLIFFACRKTNTSASSKMDTLLSQTTGCSYNPDYGDTIFFSKWKGPNNDYTIKPKSKPPQGKFIAWPQGLVIDSASGVINISQSETGLRYNIGFIQSGTSDTCTTNLILGGITYVDSIYVLGNNDTLAIPYYNANPDAPPVCDGSDDTDYPGVNGNHGGNNKCEFDDDNDDDNGNGLADEPPPGQQANGQGVRVRTLSGIINLKRTLQEGIAFGTNPQNGDSKMVTIYYRLNDNSGKALQKIKVQLVYYNKASDIPATLKNEIATKRHNFLTYRLVNDKPRPPMLIITNIMQ